MTYKPFGWDQDDPESFRPLELNRTVERGRAPHAGDIHNLATAFDATGDYDMGRDGRPPLAPERLFGAIERFQTRENLEVDGVMEPGGPTVTRLNARLPEAMERPAPVLRQSRPTPADGDDPTFDDTFRALRESGRPPIISRDFDGAVEVGRRAEPELRRDEPTPLAATRSPPGARNEAPPGRPLLPGEPEPASRSDMPEPAQVLLTDLERASSDDEVATRVAIAPAILPIVLPFVLRAAAQATPWAVRALPHIQRAIQAGRAAVTVGRAAASQTGASTEAVQSGASRPDETPAQTNQRLWDHLDRAFAGMSQRAAATAVGDGLRALEARAAGNDTDNRGTPLTIRRIRRAVEICNEVFHEDLGDELADRIEHTGGSRNDDRYLPEQRIFRRDHPDLMERDRQMDASWHLRRRGEEQLTIGQLRERRPPDAGFNSQRGRASGNPIRYERGAETDIANVIGAAFRAYVSRNYPDTEEGERNFERDMRRMCRGIGRAIRRLDDGGNSGQPPAQSTREMTDMLY